MPVSDPSGSTVVELSRAEQWVVHHVLLESIGLADGESAEPEGGFKSADSPQRSVAVLEKIEGGTFEFTPRELSFLQRACDRHARTTPATADRNLASSVADRIDTVIQDPPSETG